MNKFEKPNMHVVTFVVAQMMTASISLLMIDKATLYWVSSKGVHHVLLSFEDADFAEVFGYILFAMSAYFIIKSFRDVVVGLVRSKRGGDGLI